jgi:predicted Zn-dependent peptidase
VDAPAAGPEAPGWFAPCAGVAPSAAAGFAPTAAVGLGVANGLTVLVTEQHKLPTVTLVLHIEGGDMSDPKDEPGLAGFTADMIREGTTHRTSAQLAADVDNLGATLNAGSDFGSTNTSISASGLSSSTDKLLELMSDVVLNPTFSKDELDKYKQRQLSDLEQERSQPSALAEERFHRALYQEFPAAVTLPTPESIQGTTPERLREFHDRYYVPGDAILGVIGDVKSDQVLELVRKYFGDWKGKPVPKPDWTHLPPQPPARIYLVNRPDSVQTNILAGDFGGRRVDPDYVSLSVMNRVLGGGPQARLFLNLREVHGYTYGAYSRVGDDRYREPWFASTEVRNAVTDGSLKELMAEFKRIRDEKVQEQELDEARHSIVANFALSLEQQQILLSRSRNMGLPRITGTNIQPRWRALPQTPSRQQPGNTWISTTCRLSAWEMLSNSATQRSKLSAKCWRSMERWRFTTRTGRRKNRRGPTDYEQVKKSERLVILSPLFGRRTSAVRFAHGCRDTAEVLRFAQDDKRSQSIEW